MTPKVKKAKDQKKNKKATPKASPKTTPKASPKTSVLGKVKAYCLPCKTKVSLDKDIKLIKRKLKNGNTVTILCGYCYDCKSKNCTIIANSKK